MKKVLQLDRSRRRGIMEGKIKDTENFGKLQDDFFILKKPSSFVSTGHNDQSIVSNGIQQTFIKMQKLTTMIQDLMREGDTELNNFFQAEFQLILQHHGQKLLDGVTVCMNCMRIYQFLNELYTKMEESIKKKED